MAKQTTKAIQRNTVGNRQQGNAQIGQITLSQQYKSSILPEPEDMKQYEEMLPGTTERFLTMVEKEQNHRHRIQNKEVNASVVITLLGQVFAAALAAAAFYVTYKTGSTILFGTTLVVLVSIFLAGRYISRK